jgi:hypothetical protein
MATLLAGVAPGGAAAQPIEMAAPYEYLGWGDPQPPTSVMSATGVHDLTLAFVLSHGTCNPMWDGSRRLKGGADETAIERVRAAGGDVAVSFGGWSGRKLGNSCKTPNALAAAYQKVIDAYTLKAIDIDIEHTELSSAAVRKRVVGALAIVQGANQGLEISITMPGAESGLEAAERSLVADAAAVGLLPSAWTVMPFDFGPARTDMGHASIAAVQALAGQLESAYHMSPASAYGHSGISSMNGHTDEAAETVTLEDFQTMLSFAQQNHLARFTFWSVNRDRSCAGADTTSDSCSGVSQQPLAFSGVVAQYHG